MLPVLQSGQVCQHLVLQGAFQLAGDQQLPADMAALGARLPQVLDMVDDLPQTYAHGDASPPNLLLPADEPGTIVVIDRGFGTLPGLPGRTGGRGLQGRPAQVRAGYLGSLAARSALCAIPFDALEKAVPGEQTVAMFAGRMKLTRLMLDMAAENGP